MNLKEIQEKHTKNKKHCPRCIKFHKGKTQRQCFSTLFKLSKEAGGIFADKKISKNLLFALGMAIVLLEFLPFILLGKNAVIPIHDQLDGEIFTYILHAKHFLEKDFPEFMNGMPSSALMMASPASVVYYLFFEPFYAFLANYFFVLSVAFAGMFLCVQEIWEKSWISFLAAVLFSQLPFYSVYGLSVMGQPLLVWVCVRIYCQKNTIWNYFLLFLFGIFSSLVLVGYADCLFLVLFTYSLYICRHPAKKYALYAALFLIVLYACQNRSLFFSRFVSHRKEKEVLPLSFKNAFTEMLLEGQYHAASLHKMILIFAVVVFLVCLLFYYELNKQQKKYLCGGGSVTCSFCRYSVILCILLLESCG